MWSYRYCHNLLVRLLINRLLTDLQLINLVTPRLLLQSLVASFLVEQDDRAENQHLDTNAEERPQRSQLICTHTSPSPQSHNSSANFPAASDQAAEDDQSTQLAT